MQITRKSILSGVERTLEMNVTEEQIAAYSKGMLIQHAFPGLSADEREFIKTGISPEEWDTLVEFQSEEIDDEGMRNDY